MNIMFGFKKRSQDHSADAANSKDNNDLATRLAKTRRGFGDSMADLFLGKKTVDRDAIEDLETSLLSADVGIQATTDIIDTLQEKLSRKALSSPEALRIALHDVMTDILQPCEVPLNVPGHAHAGKPFVILVVGINGAGKTTSIGKLAHYFKQQGLTVMLAAGDTFRAAAVEQLQTWGARNDVTVVTQGTGADPASVIFDAAQSAAAKNIDVMIADTAGRLHTQSNLMDELEKIKRVMKKLDVDAPHEVLLVMDAGFGQNALQQAEQFHKTLGLSGLVVTKLDGTAKGGIVFAIASKLGLPIRFIGVGEGIEDLRPFVAHDFVAALLTTNNQ
jgi:fused signal recognition particle receptor